MPPLPSIYRRYRIRVACLTGSTFLTPDTYSIDYVGYSDYTIKESKIFVLFATVNCFHFILDCAPQIHPRGRARRRRTAARRLARPVSLIVAHVSALRSS
eukprot:641060-Pleurochrysis_carterae.AAC.5